MCAGIRQVVMQTKVVDMDRRPQPLKTWLWRSYVRASLVPLLLIELSFIAIYWFTSQVVYDRSAAAITKISTEAVREAAIREAGIIARRLGTITSLTDVYADESARALAAPMPDVPPQVRANHAYSPDGVFYTVRDDGGSAVFYSGAVPVGPEEQEKVWRTLRLDPVMKSIRDSDPLIAQLYLNTNDSLNRIYPWFDVLAIYPPGMDIPTYNFYYEADASHNPDRAVVWTDSYVDPAGSGWMVSAIAPVYALDRPDYLEGVVGIDITIDTIVDQVLDIDLEGDGYAILVGRDGTILALPPAAESDLGLSELLDHSYEEAILEDTFKPDSFNIYRRPELADLAAAIQSGPAGNARADLGRPMIAGWATVDGPNWKLVTLTSEESVLSGASTLREQLALVSKAMLAILVLFYLGFFLVLWRRSAAMSRRVAAPLSDIEGNMIRIADGGTVPPDHRYEVAELQTVGDHLVTMGEKLQAASRAKSNFLSAMSHELRTPLNAILGFSELLSGAKGEPIDGERARQVEAIHSAGWHLLQLVEGVIELSRIEQGEVHQSLVPLDVLPIARQAMDDIRPGVTNGIRLTVVEPETALPPVRGDAVIIRRILGHLISNGVKYNREGGTVTVFFTHGDGLLSVHVADDGIGIPAAMQPRLFTPFDRLGHENGTISGTGIGLTVCRKLADLTGCDIGFTSTEGKGSTFTLRIPLA
ncbi:MAG: ATPase [Rhodobacter sp. CACIA14H1]|nr:MAG: ATPase [Rhodobacter sp. CACIA14H1]